MCVFPLNASPGTVHLCEVALVRIQGELSDTIRTGALTPFARALVAQARSALILAAQAMEEHFQTAAECVAEEMLIAGQQEQEELAEVSPW